MFSETSNSRIRTSVVGVVNWIVVSCVFAIIVPFNARAEEVVSKTYEFEIVPSKSRAQVVTSNAKTAPSTPESPNPFLSYLGPDMTPDYDGWKVKLKQEAKERRQIRLQAATAPGGSPTSLLPVNETEGANEKGLNDSPSDAEYISGFGTGSGDDPEADISGSIKPAPAPRSVSANVEDDGQINLATVTGLMSDDGIIVDVLSGGTDSQVIGDGPHGSVPLNVVNLMTTEENGDTGTALATGLTTNTQIIVDSEIGDGTYGASSGDFDLFAFDISGTQQVIVDVARTDGSFRPIVAVYRPDGTLAFAVDDLFSPGTAAFTANLTVTGGTATWYVAVGGNLNLDGVPDDEFLGDSSDASTGPGIGSTGLYTAMLTFPSDAPGDFDFYSFDGLAGDQLTIEVDTDPYFSGLDPIVAVFDSAGTLLGFNDDDSEAFNFDSFLDFTVPSDGVFYVAVGGFSSFPTDANSFPSDAFDSSSGPGVGSEGEYDLILRRGLIDVDFYSFDLVAGDIIAANIFGGGLIAALFDGLGTLRVGSLFDVSGTYPASSTLPTGGNSSFAYIVADDSRYSVAVLAGSGAYTLELRAFRPPQEATGIRQRLFIDFDGADVDTGIYGVGGTQPRTLSPLSAFLSDWGLAPQDEDAVIDAILATLEFKLKQDIKASGANSAFDIEILNSRDHTDEFGDSDVSRIIVGGTISESGISTLGIAQSIDVGNYDQSETALVLLDSLSEIDVSSPNSLNNIALDAGATIIDLIGVTVGNIVAHEAGHFFADWHTDNSNQIFDIMDAGGNLLGLIGVGPDGIFGSGDDSDTFFEIDEFSPSESFFGIEDTKNTLAFGLTSGILPPKTDVSGVSDVTGDMVADIATFIADDSGSPEVHIISGATGQTFSSRNFINSIWEELAIATVNDGNRDGIDNDPAIAMLAQNPGTSKILVQTRFAGSGTSLGNIEFFNIAWTPLDIAVINDINGDGNSDDPAICVLATNPITSKIGVQVRRLSNGSIVATRYFLNPAWDAVALDIVERPGQTPLVGVMAINPVTNRTVVQSRRLSDGAVQLNSYFLNTDWRGQDISVEYDQNSDGNANDPAWLVLATNQATQKNAVQARSIVNAAVVKNVFYLNPAWVASRVSVTGDTSGNTFDEVAVSARNVSNDKEVIQVRDFGTMNLTRNIFP